MILKCTNLTVEFRTNGDRVSALAGVEFQTGEHEFLSIVGPTGCGKTTLLRTLAGIVRPQAGTVDYLHAGKSPGPVLLVFQEQNLFPWMTVLENATFGLKMSGVPEIERNRMALELLARFHLTGREQAYPKELSLGMKQRVAIIRAFLSNPAILLMDEPFAALDFQTRLMLQDELLSLWAKTRSPVVFVTHDIDEAIRLSDRILVLSHQPGRVIAEHWVPFLRPRSLGVTTQAAFVELKKRIAEQLGLPPWAEGTG